MDTQRIRASVSSVIRRLDILTTSNPGPINQAYLYPPSYKVPGSFKQVLWFLFLVILVFVEYLVNGSCYESKGFRF